MVFTTFHERRLPVLLLVGLVLLLAAESASFSDTVSLKRTREVFETRHREYIQTLESNGPETTETLLAFDRYMLAYQRYKQAQAADIPQPMPAADDEYQKIIDDGPGVRSDLKIGTMLLKSGEIRSAFKMYSMALGRVFVSPFKVMLIKLELFKDRIFGPPPPPDDDISGDIRPPVQPPAKEDTNWVGDFKYERIMSDSSFTKYDAMSVEEVQSFLEKRGSVLAKSYRGQQPAEMIINASKKHGISPKVLLARVQTEQGLVSRKSATQHQLDWAMGVGCYDSGNWNTKFKGLDKQFDYAAATLKTHYDRGQDLIAQNGVIAMTIDGTPLRVRNAATYSMYKYTPHKHGSKLFYDVYVGYFALLFLLMGAMGVVLL